MVSFAFSSISRDLHAGERLARLKRESKCKSEESDKAHRSVLTSCLDSHESKLRFSHMSFFETVRLAAARAAPNDVKKGATFLLVFRCLNHTASARKAFHGFQKRQLHSKKHKLSKNIFVDDRFRGHHPCALTGVIRAISLNSLAITRRFVISCSRGSFHSLTVASTGLQPARRAEGTLQAGPTHSQRP